MSSNFSLVIVNLFIGMCRGAAGVPRVLRDLGYEDKWIERQFPNQDFDLVHPELVLASRAENHTLLLEAKSGANTQTAQLARYDRVETADLRERLFLPHDETGSHDVTIVGLEEHEQRLRIGIEGQYDFPLLVASNRGLALRLNEFQVVQLNTAFQPYLGIDWDSVTLSWIPFDHDSELWEVAEVVIPEVVARMVKREPRIEAAPICSSRSSWAIIGRPEKNQMEAKVRQVFREAATNEFRSYLRLRDGGLDVTNNPLELDVPGQSLAFRRLQRLQREFLGRLRVHGDQLELPV